MTSDPANRLDLSDCALRESTFRSVDLAGVHFRDVQMSGAVIRDADLSAAQFADVRLRGARFTDVDFRDAEIRDSNLTGLSIDGILVTDLVSIYRTVNGTG